MSIKEITVPDLGGAEDVDVIEINVAAGDTVVTDDPLVTLESDKASMEVPAPEAGTIKEIVLKVGDKVSEGALILKLDAAIEEKPKSKPKKEIPTQLETQPEIKSENGSVYAGPGVRRLAHEQNIDLSAVTGTGPKGRITKEDILKSPVSRTSSTESNKFGPIETQALSKIKKISGGFLLDNWNSIPHVTQFDEADITDLEAFRKDQKQLAEKAGVRLTPLAFIMKAVVATLKDFPIFNASLTEAKDALVLKKYFNIGVAVDTPNGLVVPVIRDVDQKGVFELARELATISEKARTKGLAPGDMQGGCFSISSLGGIGGTAFTPIINAPEVAILGVSKAFLKPVWQNDAFVPRLMLPLSLSYDHRVIDGADAARFTKALVSYLSDMRLVLL